MEFDRETSRKLNELFAAIRDFRQAGLRVMGLLQSFKLHLRKAPDDSSAISERYDFLAQWTFHADRQVADVMKKINRLSNSTRVL